MNWETVVASLCASVIGGAMSAWTALEVERRRHQALIDSESFKVGMGEIVAKRVEILKSDLATANAQLVERLRAEFARELVEHQVRFNARYLRLSDFADSFILKADEVRAKLDALLSDSMEYDVEDPEGDQLLERIEEAMAATMELRNVLMRNRLWMDKDDVKRVGQAVLDVLGALSRRLQDVLDALRPISDSHFQVDLNALRASTEHRAALRSGSGIIEDFCRKLVRGPEK